MKIKKRTSLVISIAMILLIVGVFRNFHGPPVRNLKADIHSYSLKYIGDSGVGLNFGHWTVC